MAWKGVTFKELPQMPLFFKDQWLIKKTKGYCSSIRIQQNTEISEFSSEES